MLIIKEYARVNGGPLGKIDFFEFTTSLKNHSVRQWEVAEWVLNRHFHGNAPKSKKVRTCVDLAEVDVASLSFAWVALDDDTSLTLDPRYLELCAPRTVQTDSRIGLTDADAERAISILSSQIEHSAATIKE